MSPISLDATRRQIAAKAKAEAGIAATLLFEAADSDPRRFVPSAASSPEWLPDQGVELSSGSLLVRWLRTNNAYLDVPDTIGVWEELPDAERHTLTAWRVGGCAPLVLDEELIGWLGFIDTPEHPPASGRSRLLMAHAHAWAMELHDAQVITRTADRSEAVSRSNRLHLTGQLAAGIAHEVRNPLAAIRSTVQLIRDEDIPPARQRHLLDGILDDVDRINRVVGDMMRLGKPRTSHHERCDIATIVRGAVDFCVPYAKRIGQHIDARGSGSAAIDGDAAELRQVLVNLILNGCQAGRPGDGIRVELETEDVQPNQIVLRVIDQGAGMSSDVLARAFEPFYSTKADGGGLGLAISRDIIRRHHGELVLASLVGHGTTATIRLPR